MHVLVTRRLTLRQVALPDAEDIAQLLSNWNVARMLGPAPFPCSGQDAERWISGLAAKSAGLVYTIHRERLIGIVSLQDVGQEPIFEYWLGEPWHGRGYMTEAARALLTHAFAARGHGAVESWVFTDNPSSLRVQQKLGFVVTGRDAAWSRARGAVADTWKTRLTAAAFAEPSATWDRPAA